MLVESAHTSEAAVKSVAPAMRIGRLPYLSLSGPKSTRLTAKTKKKTVSVRPTSAWLAPK